MDAFYLFLYVVAGFCFAVLAVSWLVPARRERVQWWLMELGLLAWVLVPLIRTARSL